MQDKTNLLESKQGTLTHPSQNQDIESKWREIESEITAVKAKQDADFLVFSSKLTQLEEETTSHKLVIQDHETRITQLEVDKAGINDTAHTFFQDHDTRINQLEVDRADINDTFQTNIQEHGSRIMQLEAFKTNINDKIQKYSSSELHNDTVCIGDFL